MEMLTVIFISIIMCTGSDPSWSIDPGTIMRPGPVQLVKKISEGGYGSTFKGMWRNTVVAVKVLNDSENINFGDLTTELDLMYKVHHPHVVQLFGAVVKQKPYMVVMEYMTGGSLYDVLKEGGNFTFWRSLMLMLDFARGMDHLHNRSQAITHGDLRPSSLLLGGPKAFNNFHKFLLIGRSYFCIKTQCAHAFINSLTCANIQSKR
jgi:serine/threonine protein kinase